MSKVIYKYPLEQIGSQKLKLPNSAQILEINVQNGQVFVWALVEDGDNTEYSKEIKMVGTGWDCDVEWEDHIGTVFIGPFVWHYFTE